MILKYSEALAAINKIKNRCEISAFYCFLERVFSKYIQRRLKTADEFQSCHVSGHSMVPELFRRGKRTFVQILGQSQAQAVTLFSIGIAT